MTIASIVSYLPHILFGRFMSMGTDLIVSMIVGSIVYVYAVYKLKQLRGAY